MPTILRIHGIRFFFYANDHEPIHVHIEKAGAKAKIQMEPDVKLITNQGFSPKAIKKVLTLCQENQELFIESWRGFYE